MSWVGYNFFLEKSNNSHKLLFTCLPQGKKSCGIYEPNGRAKKTRPCNGTNQVSSKLIQMKNFSFQKLLLKIHNFRYQK